MEPHILRRVVATSDLGEGSDVALRTAAELATGHQAELRLFHCVPRPAFPYWKSAVGRATREAWIRKANIEFERQCGRVLGDSQPAADLVVGFGTPSAEIGRFAARVAADVIVLGPHEPRMVFDDLLGTTADRVLRTSHRPCLLAHRPLTRRIGRALVASDFSPHARRALQIIVDWLATTPAPDSAGSADPVIVEVLHVYAFASPLYRPFDAEPLLAKEIDAARQGLPAGSRVELRSRTLSAPQAVEGIARVADETQPDVIVLGTHGGGFVERTLTGSTASSVTRAVRHPLLLVPSAIGPRAGQKDKG